MKKFLTLLLALVMALSLIPTMAMAATSGSESMTTDGIYNDKTWREDGNGSITTDDGLILSKKATYVSENTYTIDLSVQTTQTTTTTTTAAPAATVLVIDCSGSMAWCSNNHKHTEACYTKEECTPERNSTHWYEWRSKLNHRPDTSCRYDRNSGKYYMVSNTCGESQHTHDWASGGDWCGGTGDSRMTSAKAAATKFIDSYKTANTARWIAIVSFAGTASSSSWSDVSGTEGYNSAKDYISKLKANGGTNLDEGLREANRLMTADAVTGIVKENKNVIALTDGVPTQSKNHGNGYNGSADINTETSYTAASLKNNINSLYTISFGDSNETCYAGGPTMGDFLEDRVASSGKSFTAATANDLQLVFDNITSTITSGLTGEGGWTVTDPMADNISVVDGSTSSEFVLTDASSKTYTWTLSNPNQTPNGNTTTYTYTTSYIVKIDPNGKDADGSPLSENKFYPTNEVTTLNYQDADGVSKAAYFPVPGVKVTQPKTVVTPVSFTVNKIDADTKAVLPGAVFTLTNNNNVEVNKTTNANGDAVFTCGDGDGQIPTGRYTLAETTAPENHDGTLKTWTVSVSASQVYNAKLNQYEVTYSVDVTEDKAATGTENTSALTDGVLTVENKLSTGVITIQKEFAQKSRLDGDDIKSVTVNVLDKDNEVVGTVTLNKENQWTATTKGLVYGTYTVKEVDASVAGYKLTVTYNYGEGATAVDLDGPDANVTITNSYAKQIIPRPTPTTPVEKISPKTADAGIAIYGVLSVMSVLGTGLVIGKKKEF